MKVHDSRLETDKKTFWKVLLNRNIPSDYLDEMSFSIFGLGDSKYDKYVGDTY